MYANPMALLHRPLPISIEIRAALSPVFFIVIWFVRIETRSQNQLVDLTSANKVGAWRDKVQQVTFLQRFVVSLFPAWDNCSKAGW
jgi:hypothetical protein